MFGGGGGRKPKGPQKAKAKLKEIHVTLEDVYKGKLFEFEHSRKRTCVTCDGKGGKNAKTCPVCKGKRVVEKMVMLGPGMYTHST